LNSVGARSVFSFVCNYVPGGTRDTCILGHGIVFNQTNSDGACLATETLVHLQAGVSFPHCAADLQSTSKFVLRSYFCFLIGFFVFCDLTLSTKSLENSPRLHHCPLKQHLHDGPRQNLLLRVHAREGHPHHCHHRQRLFRHLHHDGLL
jgi:hypothetical protein